MYHNRIIPCLLLDGQGLVKTVKFAAGRYLGDPINAVRIYNDSEVDELIFLDISASKHGRGPNYKYLAKITQQCFMPVCYGGGITNTDEIRRLFEIGFEKVSVNAALGISYQILAEASEIFGSQSIVGAMDVRRAESGERKVYIKNGSVQLDIGPVEHAVNMERCGAGEILINSIDNDGVCEGYDIELIRDITKAVGVPVTACGGAGTLKDCRDVADAGASAAAAGSLFVYWGRKKAVLINYPDKEEIGKVFE